MSKLKSLISKSNKSVPIAITSDSKDTDNTSLDTDIKRTVSQINTPIEQTRWNGWGNVNINKKVSHMGQS